MKCYSILRLQDILPTQSPHTSTANKCKTSQVNRSFLNGLHVVRSSDPFWAGLSTDLIIEQVLMRSMKTTGGLTRGRGMSETQRLVWLMSMPACADINNSMQNLTGTNFLTSEQHKDTTKVRQERDQQDTNTIIRYLSKRSPFDSESSLRNIATGVVADDCVNCDKSQAEGRKYWIRLLERMHMSTLFARKIKWLL